MARDGIRNELPDAFRKALQSYEPVLLKNIKIKNNGVVDFVNVIIQQITSPDAVKGMVMVVFEDVSILIESGNNNQDNVIKSITVDKEQEDKLVKC